MSADLRTMEKDVADQIVAIPLHFPARRAWWLMLAVAMGLLALFAVSLGWLFAKGPGLWGNNIPVGWGFPIINYVCWLGIAHAGTLISAMLLLLGQEWRSSLNRFAEAMTLFAAICAGLYPILHLGRPWRFYWMAPYANSMDLWPQFKSPLSWDFFAVIGYLIVSGLFWYIGIIPDLATARDRAEKRRWRLFFGLGALGWRGSSEHWARWIQAYRLIAAMAVPLVAVVTASYALLFAGGPVHGWASTIFPPYFLVGAVFSGFALVSILTVALRHFLGLRNIVTDYHLDRLGMMLLTTGMLTLYGYIADAFSASYSGGEEWQTLLDRWNGAYAWSYWGAVLLNFAPLQALWWRKVRTCPRTLLLIGLSAAVGMWLERYMLVITGPYRDWLPSSDGSFHSTFWDWGLFAGSMGLFLTLFLLFVRFLPVVSVFEVKRASSAAAA